SNDQESELPKMNRDAFLRRSRSAPVSRDERRSVKPPGVLYDLYRFCYRSTVRLPGVLHDDSGEEAPLPGLYDVSISDHAFQRIRYEARKLTVSVNDWLLAALFVALAEWTENHRPEPHKT